MVKYLKVDYNKNIMENLNFEKAKVLYDPKYLDENTSKIVFETISKLFEKEEPNKVVDENGKNLYTLSRKTRVFIDTDVDINVIPKIWGSKVKVESFPDFLIKIKTDMENKLNFKFNICLVNYYTHGKKNINWHSDNEEKGSISCIASISLGAKRKFMFRERVSKNIYKEISLKSGSLLVMGKGCQENYDHCLPVDKNCNESRLNLTFRLFDSDRYKNY